VHGLECSQYFSLQIQARRRWDIVYIPLLLRKSSRVVEGSERRF
jgi:hypothetical protein